MDWLRTMNQLYLSGRATDDKSVDWSIYIAGFEQPRKENLYCYSTKCVLDTRYSASTGVVSTSDKKRKAFRLLELLHTDFELGNCLIYGANYSEKDGYAVNAKGNQISAYLNKLVFGLEESVLWDADSVDWVRYASIEDKLEFYEQYVVESPIMGMRFKADDASVNLILTAELMDRLWKSGDLEGELERLKAQLEETDLSRLIEEMRNALNGR